MHPSPLHARFEQADAAMMSFGDLAIVAMHDAVETEYGRLRNGAAVMDCPHRALLRLTGNDRTAFVHGILTGDVNTMAVGDARRMLLLTAQGRIMADLVVIQREDRTLIDVDRADAAALAAEFDKLLFSEDVTVADHSDTDHRISLHGPEAWDTLNALSSATLEPLEPGRSGDVQLAGIEAVAIGTDTCGVAGVDLWLAGDRVAALWDAIAPAVRYGADPPPRDATVRPLGWLAFNIARIEAFAPLFHVDFGPDSLPGETGIVDRLVSFTKGCYRGQEVVARMNDRGHPAKLIVPFESDGELLPAAGSPLHDQPHGPVVGAVTSSTLSPLRSGKPIGLAMVKWGLHEPGTSLHAPAEGQTVAVTVTARP